MNQKIDFRPTCTHLDSPVLTWTHLDTPGHTCTHLYSPGLTWTHLDIARAKLVQGPYIQYRATFDQPYLSQYCRYGPPVTFCPPDNRCRTVWNKKKIFDFLDPEREGYSLYIMHNKMDPKFEVKLSNRFLANNFFQLHRTT